MYTSLALGGDGNVHISYYDYAHFDLNYATNKSGSWVIEPVDSARNIGGDISLALDSGRKAHISYYEMTYHGENYDVYDLRYATDRSGAWVAEIVDSAGWLRGGASLALDSEGGAHISYRRCFFYFCDLNYATNKSGAWVTETLDSGGGYTSLALDSEGKVHISYYGSSDLKYVTNKSGSWVTETVDSAGDRGEYTSLALDSEGKAHISYSDDTNGDLKYVTNKSGAWVSEIVDSTVYVFSGTSLALDSEGKAHISYLDPIDSINGNLKYATNKNDAWVTETVDSTGFVGAYASLAMDGDGRPHISYYDHTAYDLNYTAIDQDGDDVCFNQDNCPDYFNPDQQDSDGDGAGDVCDGNAHCPVIAIYGNHSEEAKLLRNLRDRVLKQTAAGQELIKMYYLWSPVVVKAMEEHDGFKGAVKELIDAVLLVIERKM